MLDDRGIIYIHSLLYKSVHNIVAINIDEHNGNHVEGNMTTRKMFSISICRLTAKKNCNGYSFLPITVVEWNRLPATIRESPSVDTFKTRLCSIKLSTRLTRNNCLVTSAVRYTRTPTTDYPVCGDLIVVLDKNSKSYES